MIFDLPGEEASFELRLRRLHEVIAAAALPWVQAVPQFRVDDEVALAATLARVVAGGGEGLMLHRADARWQAGRSDALLKLTPFLDAEARVVAHLPGKGRHAGVLGALELESARTALATVLPNFPIRLTRHLDHAKQWLRQQARGNERYGIVVSSQAQRLKPHAIDVRVKVDPVQWFLESKEDVRSSYYLEDVATEFQVQGLELDWTCVVWDGDLRLNGCQWDHFSFKGKRWERVRKDVRQRYLLNAYRVLLTRARQGMVIVVPEGSADDPIRAPAYYDPAVGLLASLGIPPL